MNPRFPSEDTAKNAVRVWSLIKDLKVAMVTTGPEGSSQAPGALGFETCPLRALFEEHADALWFIVPRGFVGEQRSALLTFSNGSDGDHVAIHGTLFGAHDRAKLEKLWNAHADIAFPLGVTDPDAALMKFEPAKASFWAGGTDVLSFVVNFLEAKITGNAPEVGQHGVVPETGH